jgi:hypothetical protein
MCRGRAYRRHQDRRIKDKTKRKMKAWSWSGYRNGIWGGGGGPSNWEPGYSEEEAVGTNASVHCCACSKPRCCGNPRRLIGAIGDRLTRQELRQLLSDWEPYQELSAGSGQPRARRKRTAEEKKRLKVLWEAKLKERTEQWKRIWAEVKEWKARQQ